MGQFLEQYSPLLFLFSGFVAMAFGAFFTASEIALISCDKVFLRKKKELGLKSAEVALKNVENIDRLLTTTQFGTSVSIATATTLITIFLSHAVDKQIDLFLFLIAPCILFFTDILPKVIARQASHKISILVAYPMSFFIKILSPITNAIFLYIQKLSSIVGIGKQDTLSRRKKVREELLALLQDSDSESEIRLGHKRIIRKVLDFSQQNVKKIMIPLVNIDAIENTATIQNAISVFESTRHSRIPVYEERIDNIIGILHFNTLFQSKDLDAPITNLIKPAFFVPEYQQLESLTQDMKMQEAYMAIAVDEYGGAIGIVTKEDILEEIVGNISDEFDEDNLSILEMSANTFLVHVKTEINDVNDELKINIPKGDYETLSGFLLQQFNRIPTVGDELYFSNMKFKVHRATEKAIQTVIISIFHGSQNETKDKK